MLTSLQKQKFHVEPKTVTKQGPQAATMCHLWMVSRKENAPDVLNLPQDQSLRKRVSRDHIFTVIKDELLPVAVGAGTSSSRGSGMTGGRAFGSESEIGRRQNHLLDWALRVPTESQTLYNLPADQTVLSAQYGGTGEYSYQHIGSDAIYTVPENIFTQEELDWLRLNNYLP
jgi:hypothetical protein